ncbi:hypothetical protein SCD92_09690 [Gilvimarinus sp. SDUM040013]|uniref:Uncharacterized protein n=1 Tax=Gilvimarinus gilvus TaxID=3058038 RepID=A0ABU4RZH9_9GAMM|nr:hypothetical protein [Gilvimarinus sp. SDUM040013]MDX6849632.1 hypothetical protein [Gilvimarinus sp. SDUM040013]
MCFNLWGFLSVCVIFGTSFVMFLMYLENKKSLKKMALEALKLKQDD